MAHLERRRQLWYATLTVPIDLRDHFGKFKLIQSLGTPDKRIAEVLAAQLVATWKSEFLKIRGASNPIQLEAIKWKKAITQQRKAIAARGQFAEAGLDELEDQLYNKARLIEETSSEESAEEFLGIVKGTRTPSNILREQWEAQLDLAAKTKEQMIKDVDKLLTKFTTLEGITKKAVHEWAWGCIEKKENTESSMGRVLAFSRNYWRYLQKAGKVDPDNNPLNIPNISRDTKKTSKGGKSGWIPFAPTEIVTLWKAARASGDEPLANLIQLGAYTGARIEELCSLKKADFKESALKITDAKTEAGNRVVPVHSAILPLVKKLAAADDTSDEYLIPGLTFNKFGDRSNAIGKRFGRLKEAGGFGSNQVFHSIRKTLVTLLENAGVSENLAADIVGHEKPRITYGLYSGGASLEVKREALEKIKYPFPRQDKW